MKRIKRASLCFALALGLALPAAIPAASGAAALSPRIVTIELGSNGYENFYMLTNALCLADSSSDLTIRIAKAGTYTVSSSGRALMMRSNTMLDLNGSTLVRGGEMYNFIQNEDLNGSRDNGGYDQTCNFGIRNGVLDGSGGSSDEVNLVNLGHASNILIENVDFRNCRGGHLIEMTGCRDSRITRCSFTGYNGDATGDNEAIQLDICNNSAGGTWNGVYLSDNTVCRNITVDRCEFNDYPSGVGNHHTLKGIHNSGIRITDNVFKNSLDTYETAIWCYFFEDSVVENNVISGNYGNGIMISGGSVSVEGNTVSGTSETPLYITKSSSYIDGQYKVRADEPASGCAVIGNTLYSKSSPALCVYSGSGVKEVSLNGITSEGAEGVSVSGSNVGTVYGNLVRNCGGTGIFFSSSATVKTVQANTVTGCGGYGIQINNSNITVAMGQNSLSSNSGGNQKINASTSSLAANNNLPTPELRSAVNEYDGVKLSWNAVSGAEKYRVFRKDSNSGSWGRLGDVASTSFTDTSVEANGSYIYTVRCVSADGKTYRSAYDTGGLLITFIPAPFLTEAVYSNGGIDLKWNAVKGASGYRVFYRNSDGGWSRIGDYAFPEMKDKGVGEGESRVYTVRALNGRGEYVSGYDPSGIVGSVPAPTTNPVTTVPVTTEPATTAPVTTESATTAPVTTEPATTAPVTTESATTEPVTTVPVPEKRLGDVNGDGKVDVTDATLVQMHSARLIELSADKLELANVNHDKKVDITDATLIQMCAVKLIVLK